MPSILKDNAFAVTWSEDDGFGFLYPSGLNDTADMPDEAVFLAAVTSKASEEEFVQAIVSKFDLKNIELG